MPRLCPHPFTQLCALDTSLFTFLGLSLLICEVGLASQKESAELCDQVEKDLNTVPSPCQAGSVATHLSFPGRGCWDSAVNSWLTAFSRQRALYRELGDIGISRELWKGPFVEIVPLDWSPSVFPGLYAFRPVSPGMT